MKSYNKIYRYIFVTLMVVMLFFSNAYNLYADYDTVNASRNADSGAIGQEQISAQDNVILEVLYNDDAISSISHSCLFKSAAKVQSEKFRYGIFAGVCLIAVTFFLILGRVCLPYYGDVLHFGYFIIRFIHRKDGKKRVILHID